MSVIRISGLAKCFGPSSILKGINLDVKEGETVSIIGNSGSGKSTLLRCLNFLDLPSQCSYWLNDHPIRLKQLRGIGLIPRSKEDMKCVQRTIGMIFQDFGLWPHMTLLENVTRPQVLSLGRSAAAATKYGLQQLERVGMKGFSQAYPAFLSGGQKQRAAIARTLALDKRIILMDEPTSALDPLMTLEIQEIIQQLARERRTLLVVSHDMDFASRISDRIVFIKNGKITEEGPPAQIFKNGRNPFSDYPAHPLTNNRKASYSC